MNNRRSQANRHARLRRIIFDQRGSQLSRVSFLAVALAYLAVAPPLWGVNPPPDGGYLNCNTAEGDDALLSLTTGSENTADWFCNRSLATPPAAFNTAIGFDPLFITTPPASKIRPRFFCAL